MKKYKKKINTIVSILLLTILVTTFALPTSNAYDPDVPTYAFISVAPNPLGVGQTTFVTMWIDKMPPLTASRGIAIPFGGITLTVTKPDGTKQIMGPYETDPVGALFVKYTPDAIGTYTFKFSFPGQNFTKGFDTSGTDVSGYYMASVTKEYNLTVQQDPIGAWPEIPLPNDYWDRPIEGQNKLWGSIGGNWIGNLIRGQYNVTGSFNPYTTGPNTAHIVWTEPIEFGGIVGEPFGDDSYYEGLSYEMRFRPPTIIGGRLYYNLPLGNLPTGGGTVCVDVRTGEQIWKQNITITMGQLFRYESPNQHGVNAYLWDLRSPTYSMYDAFSGELLTTFPNATAPGRLVEGPNGELLVYILNDAAHWLCMWNSSLPSDLLLGPTGTDTWQWRPTGKTVDWKKGIQWNVTIPTRPYSVPLTFANKPISDEVLVASAPVRSADALMVVGFSAKTGAELWNFNITTAMCRTAGWNFGPIRDGIFTYFLQEKLQTYGYDALTGKQLWGPTEPYSSDWSMYYQSYAGSEPYSPAAAYGKLYATSYDGMVHCHDLKTGKQLWEYSTGNSGLETPYGVWPTYCSPTIADDKLYVATSEHSPNSPIWRGEKLHCINATTGEFIWSISGVMTGSIIADGYLLADNCYDAQIYCFGKGQTATTVTAPQTVLPQGSSLMITGAVTDQSPGAKNTPAIADENMSSWMEYLYMQKEMPINVKGVEVSLDTRDPNGNYVHIGTVTSDASGNFKKMWTPEVPGEYTIIATFKGSESYWSSSAETAIGVSEAAPTASPIAAVIAPPTEMYIGAAAAAIIIAIAIGFAITILTLRKRP